MPSLKYQHENYLEIFKTKAHALTPLTRVLVGLGQGRGEF